MNSRSIVVKQSHFGTVWPNLIIIYGMLCTLSTNKVAVTVSRTHKIPTGSYPNTLTSDELVEDRRWPRGKNHILGLGLGFKGPGLDYMHVKFIC